MTPRGHHAASIQLLRLLHSMTGADPVAKSLIDRCEATPPSNDAPFAMAYDTYLTSAPGGLRWGFTINDRFDDDFDTLLREFAAISGHSPNLVDRVAAVRGALDSASTEALSAGRHLGYRGFACRGTGSHSFGGGHLHSHSRVDLAGSTGRCCHP